MNVLSIDRKDVPNAIKNGKITLCVVGGGYVGLPFAALYADLGAKVIVCNRDQKKVDATNAGNTYIYEIGLDELVKSAVTKGNLTATTNVNGAVAESDIIFITVGTPVKTDGFLDDSQIKEAAKNIGMSMKKGSLIVLRSTVNPGTTEDVLLPILEEYSGMKLGDFGLADAPERLQEGKALEGLRTEATVVGGDKFHKKSAEITAGVFDALNVPVSIVSYPTTSEFSKFVWNYLLDSAISDAQIIAQMCEKIGIDFMEVRATANMDNRIRMMVAGPGSGGSCLDAKEFVFFNNEKKVDATTIGDYVNGLIKNQDGVKVPEKPTKMLSFDLKTGKAFFAPVKVLTKRKHKKLLEISTSMGRKISVTPDHPMIVYEGGFKTKLAMDVERGDKLPIISTFSEIRKPEEIDIISYLAGYKIDAKVKPKNFRLIDDKRRLDAILKEAGVRWDKRREMLRFNFLPLDLFLRIEKRAGFKRNDFEVYTGVGRITKIPAIIKVDENFSRLIGYYLSEGFLTEDKSLRTGFAFNKKERYYINDLCAILRRLCIKHSVNNSGENVKAIKVSSKVFGLVIRDLLRCGTNSNNKKIPQFFYRASKELKENLISGLFRGDGSVVFSNQGPYISIEWATTSRKLFEGALFILHSLGYFPGIGKMHTAKTKSETFRLRVSMKEDVERLSKLFKMNKNKINNFYKNREKTIKSTGFENMGNFGLVRVKTIKELNGNFDVYSAEVEGTHTIVSSGGLVVHNCFPKDVTAMFALAKKVGIEQNSLKSVELVRVINGPIMAEHVVSLVESALKENNIPTKDAEIGILGLAFKGETDDTRESPALKVVEILRNRCKSINAYDPFVKTVKSSGNLRVEDTWQDALENKDCCVILTDHKEFYKIEPEKIRKIMKNNCLVDSRHIINPELARKIFVYRGVGRGAR